MGEDFVVFIFNKKGYIGNSTLIEIGAAHILNKPLYAFDMKNIQDESVRILIDDKARSVEELINKLR